MIKHLYHLSQATTRLTGGFVKALWYVYRNKHKDLELPPSVFLSQKEDKRYKHYLFGTSYLSFIFCTLRGSNRTDNERYLFSNLAALTPFFDDLADAYRHKDDTGTVWYNNPETYGQVADERGLSLHLLQNIYKKLPPQYLLPFKDIMHEVFNVETEGRQQTEKTLILEHIEHITADKGGYSVLLFRRLLAHDLDEKEYAALYQLGNLIQICDDILDFWFDRQEGIATIPRYFMEQNRLSELSQFFDNQVDITHNAFKEMPYPKGRTETAFKMLHFLISITRLALQRYGELEKKYGTIPFDTRKEMVLDMEKWGNRVRLIKYLLRC
jgi:hypothetical protein